MKNKCSMRSQISGNFEKMRIFKKIPRIFEFFEFFWEERQDNWGWRGTQRVLRAETWLTVHRTIAMRKQWLSPADSGPHKMINQCNIFSSYQGFVRWHVEKCLGFVVKRILKINMDVVRGRWANEKPWFYRSSKFYRGSFFQDFLEIFKRSRKKFSFGGFEWDEWKLNLWRHSTSPPCGNLVDGLPHDCQYGNNS